MSALVLMVGVLITVISLFLLIRVDQMRLLLDKVFGSSWLYALALLRLLLGAALIGSADSVAYSAVVELFGWLFVLGGLTLVVVPAPVLGRMAGWFGQLSTASARVWLGAAGLFGLFFVYAALV